MSEPKFNTKPIRLLLKNANENAPDVADQTLLAERFTGLAASINEAYRQRFGGSADNGDAIGLLAIVADFLPLMTSFDEQYGADSELPVTDADHAVDEAMRSLAELETWLARLDLDQCQDVIHGLQLGIAYWAMRHGLAIHAAAPVVNALAARSNMAKSRQKTAAIYAMMQGFIHHLAPALAADLEKSNPERPWRLLNLNFAITAIRTGDTEMMRYAFDTLNAHLPDERAGFYEEALQLASLPGFPAETRTVIETEHLRWKRVH